MSKVNNKKSRAQAESEDSSDEESRNQVSKKVKKSDGSNGRASGNDDLKTNNKLKNKSKNSKRSDSDSDSEHDAPKNGKNGKRANSDDGSDDDRAPKKAQAKDGNSGSFEVFVAGLSFQASENDIEKHFSQAGEVESVNLLKGHDGRSKGIAFVKFGDEEARNAALELDGTEVNGRSIKVEKPTPREQRGERGGQQGGNNRDRPQTPQDPNNCTVFVGNLSYNSTEDSIRDHFSDCGEILSVRVAKDQDGNMRGFGHIDFETPSACKTAIDKAGSELDGRAINVDFAGGKKNNDRQGGFGGGRGGGRGGRGGFGGGRGGGRGGRGRY